MPNSTLVNLVRCTILNTGTGTLVLGAALPSFRGIEGLTDGNTYSYSIQQGSNYETGQGVFSQSDGTLTRGVIESSAGNAAINLSPNAVCAFPALNIDFQLPGPPGRDGAPGPQGAPGAAGAPGANGTNGAGINMPVTTETASYTLVSGDANTYLRFTAGSSVTLTVPTNASVPFAIGTVVAIEQAGAGVVTIAGAGGVTINCRGGANTSAGQFAVVQIKKVDTDVWTLLGDVA